MRLKNSWVALTLAMLAPAIYAFYVYSPMLAARLGLIDDHEFIRFLTIGGQNFAAIPSMLEGTEIGRFGETDRFRPAYYFFRAVGSVLHGTEGFQWYLVRILLFLAVVIAIAALVFVVSEKAFKLSAITSGLMAGSTGLLVAGMSSWNDIVTRLGPSELFVAWGLTVTAWGLWFLYTKKREWLGALLVALGFSLAVGSKENSISLIAPLAVALLLAVLQGGKLLWNLLAFAPSAAATLYTAMGFLPSVLSDGQDVYGQSRSIEGAFGAAVQIWQFWLALIVAVVAIALGVKSSRSKIQKLLIAALGATPLFATFSESFFYQYSVSGGNFTPGRYAIVVELVGISSLVFIGLASFVLARSGLKALRPVALVTLAFTFFPLGQLAASGGYRAGAEANAQYLNAQFNALQSTANYLKEANVSQVLYLVDEPYDYERISASRQFIEYISGETRDYFLWTDFSRVQMDQFTLPLAEELQKWSAEGNQDWKLKPLDSIDNEAPLLCVHLGAEPQASPCSQSQWIGG